MAYDHELADRLREILAPEPDLSEKAMFGGLAFLLGGNMVVAASRQGGLMLRVDPADTETLAGMPHAEPFVMRGRELDGWLRIDPAGVTDDADLRRWTALGVAYVHTLPAK